MSTVTDILAGQGFSKGEITMSESRRVQSFLFVSQRLLILMLLRRFYPRISIHLRDMTWTLLIKREITLANIQSEISFLLITLYIIVFYHFTNYF